MNEKESNNLDRGRCLASARSATALFRGLLIGGIAFCSWGIYELIDSTRADAPILQFFAGIFIAVFLFGLFRLRYESYYAYQRGFVVKGGDDRFVPWHLFEGFRYRVTTVRGGYNFGGKLSIGAPVFDVAGGMSISIDPTNLVKRELDKLLTVALESICVSKLSDELEDAALEDEEFRYKLKRTLDGLGPAAVIEPFREEVVTRILTQRRTHAS